MLRKVTLVTFILVVWFTCNSQEVSFTGYSINDGLSQSVVNCIFQDSKGFIWIGTQNGLNRFNGYNFEIFTYNPGDTNSISNNWIYGIAEDKQGNLWIGTKGGLNKFHAREKRFEKIRYSIPFPLEVTDYIYDVKCSREGMILVNTAPVLTILDPVTSRINHFLSSLPYDGGVNDNSLPLLEDRQGNIWMGSTRGLSCFDPRNRQVKVFQHDPADPGSISGNHITALYEEASGNFWVGTSDGLNLRTANDRDFIHYTTFSNDGSTLSDNFIRAIIADRNQVLWVATEGGGLNRITMTSGRNYQFERFTSQKNGLRHDIILSLAVDRSENLWIGTLSGISKADLKKKKFNLYRKSDSPGSIDLAGNVIASLYKDDGGIVWVGNWGEGLNLFDRKTGKVEHYNSRASGQYKIPNDYVHAIFEDGDKDIWIGTRDGLLVFHKQSRTFIRPEKAFPGLGILNLEGLRIYMMIQDRNRNYWIATQDGLFRMSKGKREPERYSIDQPEGKKVSANLVYALLEDSKGWIWIGTVDGLDVYKPSTGMITHYRKSEGAGSSLSDNFITSLCEDKNGDVWIGTNTYVNRYVRKNGHFSYYSQEQGLPGNIIYSILRDGNNKLWFATGNGLCIFDETTETFRTYTVEEGLQSPEFNLRASFLASDGEVFFGGMNGFNSFYPPELTDNPNIPPIAFTAAYKMVKGNRLAIDLEKKSGIILKHNEYSFMVEFAALEFTNPSKNRYAYKLEGIDDEWIDIGNRNFVAFSNLPPGDYVLRVKGSNNDGLWNETGASLVISIRPPWYRSPAAYVLYLILAIFLVFLYVRLRERKHIRDRKLLEEKVYERTLQIEAQKAEILEKNKELNDLNSSKDKFFSIIAHDLRNPFNAITGLTEVLLMGTHEGNAEKTRSTLEHIHGSSQQAHELLENLLLWARSHTRTIAFQPESLNLRSMVEETIDLVGVLATRKNISIKTEFGDCSGISGDRNMIHTVIRNLLTNALKFTSHGGEVRLILKSTDGHCSLEVRDSGVGIPPDRLKDIFSIDTSHKTKGTDREPGTGLGLILCKEFVEGHGGRIVVASEQGKGSTFTVILPKSEPGTKGGE